eukprot:689345-Pleurochrysis_carterae.AAC.1
MSKSGSTTPAFFAASSTSPVRRNGVSEMQKVRVLEQSVRVRVCARTPVSERGQAAVFTALCARHCHHPPLHTRTHMPLDTVTSSGFDYR